MSVYGFRRGATGRIVLRVDVVEKGLLGTLLEQVIEMVRPEDTPSGDPLEDLIGITGSATAPEDPALARLLPDAYRDDPEAAADFRRYTEHGLREEKATRARIALASLRRSGEKVTLAEGEADAWLGALNDMRLALGTRIGITEDNHEELAGLADDDPRSAAYHVYDWLTFLQESLVRSLLPEG